MLKFKCVLQHFDLLILVLNDVLTWLLLKVFSIGPFVASLFIEFLLEFSLCIIKIVKLVESNGEIRGIEVVVCGGLLLFALGGPDEPFELITSFEKLHFEYFDSADLVVVDILEGENT